MTTVGFCLGSGGVFLLVGLMAGAWKYGHIVRSPQARAPAYVDIAHRASLMYAFACMLLAELAGRSAWRDELNLAASAVLVSFFAVTIGGYVVHGVLRDTDNQLQRPHRLGRRIIPAAAMQAFMVLLSAGEIGAFLVILAGFFASRR